jgi:hypothetical protein
VLLQSGRHVEPREVFAVHAGLKWLLTGRESFSRGGLEGRPCEGTSLFASLIFILQSWNYECCLRDRPLKMSPVLLIIQLLLLKQTMFCSTTHTSTVERRMHGFLLFLFRFSNILVKSVDRMWMKKWVSVLSSFEVRFVDLPRRTCRMCEPLHCDCCPRRFTCYKYLTVLRAIQICYV